MNSFHPNLFSRDDSMWLSVRLSTPKCIFETTLHVSECNFFILQFCLIMIVSFSHFRFVGITIQATGVLDLLSLAAPQNDRWLVNVVKGTGPGLRSGTLTVEGYGRLTARNLELKAEKIEVDVDGWINLDLKGFEAGK